MTQPLPKLQKRQPMRMCVACRSRAPQKALLRFVRSPSGQLLWNQGGRLFGRSAYLCKKKTCLEKARKKSLLQQHLGCHLQQKFWGEVEENLREAFSLSLETNQREMEDFLAKRMCRGAGVPPPR